MSLAEIKDQVGRLSADDRDELVGFLKLLAIRNDPSRLARFTERLTRLASGTGVNEDKRNSSQKTAIPMLSDFWTQQQESITPSRLRT